MSILIGIQIDTGLTFSLSIVECDVLGSPIFLLEYLSRFFGIQLTFVPRTHHSFVYRHCDFFHTSNVHVHTVFGSSLYLKIRQTKRCSVGIQNTVQVTRLVRILGLTRSNTIPANSFIIDCIHSPNVFQLLTSKMCNDQFIKIDISGRDRYG